MNSTLRLVGVLLLIVLALAGLSTLTVSAQGPTATETPTTGAPGTQTPAAAPPAAAAGTVGSNPANAVTFGSAIPAIPAGGGTWFQFNYDTAGNAIPRPQVMIRLIDGAINGLGFEVWSPERMGNPDAKPVGRGTPEALPNTSCIAGTGVRANPITRIDEFGDPIGSDLVLMNCSTNDLIWLGGFGAPGTYHVRVINPGTTDNADVRLILSGSGIAECQRGTLPQVAAQMQEPGTQGQPGQTAQGTTSTQGTGQGFSVVQCQNPTHSQLLTLNRNMSGSATGPAPAAAPTVTAPESPTAAATETPAAAPTVEATTAASPTTTTGGGVTGTETPAAAPTVSGLPECTPTPTPAAGETPTATPTLAAGETPSPTPTPNCVMPGTSSGGATSATPEPTSAAPAGTATP
jgi:hypothetical protein